MDSKLQQAIVATRAGYIETAQILLADALQENPEETEAWFLLAHLVESPERQARYLEYTLLLEPGHALARQHLQRLLNPDIPPPVIKENSKHGSTSSYTTPPPTVDSSFSPISPARTNPVLSANSVTESSYATPRTGTQQIVVEQNSSSVDTDWQRTAGQPKRITQTPTVAPIQQQVITNTTTVTEKRQPVNKWLLAILVILVALAVFILSFLAYTMFFK
jgi:hypothetical protein